LCSCTLAHCFTENDRDNMDVVEVSILDITSLVSNHAGTLFFKRKYKIYTLTLGVIVCVDIMKSDHKNECWL